MPTSIGVLAQEATRFPKRVDNASMPPTGRLVTQRHRDIALMEQQMASVLRTLGFLEAQETKLAATLPVPEKVGDVQLGDFGL